MSTANASFSGMPSVSRIVRRIARTASGSSAAAPAAREAEISVRTVRSSVLDVDADRAAEHQLPATNGYALTPGVDVNGRPFLTLLVDDRPAGHWTPADARKHALQILEVSAVADLDGAYFRALVDRLDVGEGRAGNIVADLEKRRVGGRS